MSKEKKTCFHLLHLRITKTNIRKAKSEGWPSLAWHHRCPFRGVFVFPFHKQRAPGIVKSALSQIRRAPSDQAHLSNSQAFLIGT